MRPYVEADIKVVHNAGIVKLDLEVTALLKIKAQGVWGYFDVMGEYNLTEGEHSVYLVGECRVKLGFAEIVAQSSGSFDTISGVVHVDAEVERFVPLPGVSITDAMLKADFRQTEDKLGGNGTVAGTLTISNMPNFLSVYARAIVPFDTRHGKGADIVSGPFYLDMDVRVALPPLKEGNDNLLELAGAVHGQWFPCEYFNISAEVALDLGLLEVDTGHTDIQLPCPGYHPKPGEEVVRMHTRGVGVYLPTISLKVI